MSEESEVPVGELLPGSISSESLLQYEEQDEWYFSEEETDNEPDSYTSQEHEEDKVLPREGEWADLCASSSAKATARGSSPADVGDLQCVLDSFVSKLEPYDTELEEEEDIIEETTDSTTLQHEADESVVLFNVSNLLSSGSHADQLQNVDPFKSASAAPSSSSSTFETPCIERPRYYHIAREIMTSERTYVQAIRLVEKVLHGAVQVSRDTHRPVLLEKERKSIFSNMTAIYSLNSNLLMELENRLGIWEETQTIADLILNRAPFFKLYSMYTSQFDSAQMTYFAALKKRKGFFKLVDMIEKSHLSKGLPLSSYMICPIQRIPRYRLLLQDYLKHLPDGHPDKKNTVDALKSISEVATHLNERIKDLEGQALLVKLQKCFVGGEVLVAPGRKFISRGPVEMLSGRKLNQKKQRVLFLFSDILVVSTPVSRSRKYKIRSRMELKELRVSEVRSQVVQNGFFIVSPYISKPLMLCTRTYEERDIWVKELKDSIMEEVDKRLSFGLVYSRLLSDPKIKRNMNAIFFDPSYEHRQPTWVRHSLRYGLRRLVICPAGGFEDVDAGHEDAPTDEPEAMEMEKFIPRDAEGFVSLLPGMDNTLSCYMKYHLLAKQPLEMAMAHSSSNMWFVLTYSSLTGYSHHTTDVACWALALAGCRLIIPQQHAPSHRFLLVSARQDKHHFELDSEYDFLRWTNMLRELLHSDFNMQHTD